MKILNHSRNLVIHCHMVGGIDVSKIVVVLVLGHQVVRNAALKAVKALLLSAAVERLKNGMKNMKFPTTALEKTNMQNTIAITLIVLTQQSTMTAGAVGALRPQNNRKPTA